MRFSRGVVKIPIKVLYVCLVVMATTFFLTLHIRRYQRSNGYNQCRPDPALKEPKATKGGRGREKSQQNHPVCWMDPTVTRYEDCPTCFRPNTKNVSSQLHQVKYNTSLFPRGPPGLFKLKDEIQQDYIMDYLITPRLVCVDTCPFLLAILLSISDDSEQRSAIRATWASPAKTRLWPNSNINADFQTLFVLAHKTPDSYIRYNEDQAPKKFVEQEHFPTMKEWAVIKTEADLYGDILYLNMQDSYYNLTLKLLSAFKWVRDHCPRAKYILKVDMDTFVNVPLLLDLLIYNDDRLEYSLLGKLYTEDRTVLRATKWAVDHEVYPPAIFPVYASDCAYIVSARVFRRIVDVSLFMPLDKILQKSQRDDSAHGSLFITGIVGTFLGSDYYSLGDGVFTHHLETSWFWCDIIYDRKISGLTIEDADMYKLWRSFFRFYGQCWKEIPRLANPEQ